MQPIDSFATLVAICAVPSMFAVSNLLRGKRPDPDEVVQEPGELIYSSDDRWALDHLDARNARREQQAGVLHAEDTPRLTVLHDTEND